MLWMAMLTSTLQLNISPWIAEWHWASFGPRSLRAPCNTRVTSKAASSVCQEGSDLQVHRASSQRGTWEHLVARHHCLHRRNQHTGNGGEYITGSAAKTADTGPADQKKQGANQRRKKWWQVSFGIGSEP